MPIWQNDTTGEVLVIGSFEELEKYSGKKITDPHRPYVDEITFEDKINGGTFKRIPDIIDVWYDSGSVPFAKVLYPNNQELFDKRFPAQYISEGMDQTHLWFYTMLVLGVALFDKSPFENVIVTGMLLDKNSKKLSKSKGNYPPIEEVLDNYGADIFRYVILTSPLVEGEFARFYEEVLKDARKDFFLIFWNTLKIYMNLKTTLSIPFHPCHLFHKKIPNHFFKQIQPARAEPRYSALIVRIVTSNHSLMHHILLYNYLVLSKMSVQSILFRLVFQLFLVLFQTIRMQLILKFWKK